jgi:HEAT repeat protein
MHGEQKISESTEPKNTGLLRYAEDTDPGPSVVLEAGDELPRDPEAVARLIRDEVKRIREQRGKVLAGKLLQNIRQIILTLDTTKNGSDKDVICQRVVTPLDHKDIEVLSWVLNQDISGPFADALSAHIVEHADRQEDPVETGSTIQAPESPLKGKVVGKQKGLSPADRDRRLAHFKAGLTAILNGKREAFEDKQVMKALPGAVKKLYSKEKFGTAKQIIERLAAELASKDATMPAAVSDALSLSLEAVPPELRVHTTREVLNKLVSWIKSETSVSPAYERTSVQLEKLAKMLLGQREYDECVPILDAFALTRSGKLQTDKAQKAIANRLLTNVGTPDIIELLVKDFRTIAEAKSEHAGRFLSMLGANVVDPLLDALSETQDRSEQARLVQLISEIGKPAGPALNDRIKEGGPRHFMCNLATLAGRVGNENLIGPLEQLLRHEDARVREEALNSICHIGGERAGNTLLSQLAMADDAFKIKIVAVLGAKRYRNAVKPLLELLESRPALLSDERDALEERICIALGQIGSEEAMPALSAIVGQKKFFVVKPYNKKVQAAANKAIEEIIAKQYE